MEEFEKNKKKKVIIGGVVVASLLVGGGIGYISAPSCAQENHEGIDKKVIVLENLVEDKEKEVKTLNEKVTQAKPWFEMNAEEQRKIEEENARIEAERVAKEEAEKEAARLAEEKRLEEEKVAEEKRLEEERIAKENAEKNKYETGITYSQLARTPDDYKGEKCKFKGKVVQTLESDGTVQIRLAVGGSYDNVILATYSSSLVSSRILEDDYITIYGTSLGIMTYESTMGKSITIPAMLIDKIDV